MVLKDRVCPLIIKSFKLAPQFHFVIRLKRILSVFIRQFHSFLSAECEVFLSRLIRSLDSDQPLWLRAVVLEVMVEICSTEGLLCAFFEHYDLRHDQTDVAAHIFESFITSLARFGQKLVNDEPTLSLHAVPKAPRCIDMLNQQDPPSVKASYCFSLVAKCATLVISSLCNAREPATQLRVNKQMANATWPSLLPALSLLLSRSFEQAAVQSVLDSLRIFTCSCSMWQLPTPRDALLTTLIKFGLPMDEQLGQLTNRNAQAMKTLLGLAHSFGHTLDVNTWGLLLDSFEVLDQILKNRALLGQLQKSSTQESESTKALPYGSQAATSSECTFLCQLLDSLFGTTEQMDEVTLVAFLSAMCERSMSALTVRSQSALPRSPSGRSLRNSGSKKVLVQYRLFYIQKIQTVVQKNLYRARSYWKVLSPHCMFASNYEVEDVRSMAVDILVQMIMAYFASEPSDSTHAAQECFNVVKRLVQSPYLDTQQKSLDCLLALIQSYGQAINEEQWCTILDVVTPAASTDTHLAPELVPYCFRIVQLITTDYITDLPDACLMQLIHTAGSFAQQPADLNISLTAIGLLWNIADLIARGPSTQLEGSHPTLTSNPEQLSANPMFSDPPAVPSSAENDTSATFSRNDLWMASFASMQPLASDARPEVRNCILLTLFKTLTTYGHLLVLSTWRLCLKDIIFPILDQVKHSANSAGKEVSASPETAGSGHTLLVHHSRNTKSKQWNETLVHAVQGVSQVFAAFLPTFIEMADFASSWQWILEFYNSMCAVRAKEVSMSSIKSLADIIKAYAKLENSFFEASCWRLAWDSWIRMMQNVTSENRKVSEKVITRMAEESLSIFSDSSHRLTAADLHTLNTKLGPLALILGEWTWELSPLQKAVLNYFDRLQGLDSALLLQVFTQLFDYVCACTGYRLAAQEDTASVSPLFHLSINDSYLVLAKRALAVIVTLFCKPELCSDSTLKANAFGDIVKVVGSTMMTKYVAYQTDLWIDAVDAFVRLVKFGIPLLNESRKLSIRYRVQIPLTPMPSNFTRED